MNDLQIFENPEFGKIRTLDIEGEPWFVGKDVADILGYQNASKALADHVDAEDKLNNESLSSLGQRGGWIISESGLYSLILSSKLPTAKKFKRWITAEVIPSIRKTGEYKIPRPNADHSAMRQRAMLINATNKAAAEIRNALKEAGVDPNYRVLALKGVYSEVGFEVPTEGLTIGEKSYVATTIAKMLGVMSTAGNPHGQAVSAIIQDVGTGDGETKRVPFMNNGHSDSCIQYTQAVVDRVANWLKEKGYPTPIVLKKKYNVVYQEVK